jgi:hypothetical protein
MTRKPRRYRVKLGLRGTVSIVWTAGYGPARGSRHSIEVEYSDAGTEYIRIVGSGSLACEGLYSTGRGLRRGLRRDVESFAAIIRREARRRCRDEARLSSLGRVGA